MAVASTISTLGVRVPQLRCETTNWAVIPKVALRTQKAASVAYIIVKPVILEGISVFGWDNTDHLFAVFWLPKVIAVATSALQIGLSLFKFF